MKNKLLLVVCFISLVVSAQNEKFVDELQFKDDTYFLKKDNVFTGTLVTLHDNGEVKSYTTIVNGKVNGRVELFYNSGSPLAVLFENESHQNYGDLKQLNEDGTLAFVGSYISGKLFKDGEIKPFTGMIVTKYTDGSLHEIANFEKGLWHGTQTRLDRSGNTLFECVFKHNEIIDCPVIEN